MARKQAPDYEQRRDAILEQAARLYAQHGFQGASIADLALACGMSKSLIYHYYTSKEDILFDVMQSHVRALLETAERIVAQPKAAAAKLHELTQEFMRLYVGAASRHKVLLNEIPRLAPPQRETVLGIQRRLVDILQALLIELRPDLAGRPELRRPAAMLYFGMINWTHTWLHPDGGATPARISTLAVDVFLDGFLKSALA
jgi:AcrR family transcriptional regulator